tara:strand:- start:368 stop:1225 length:858 start_codon:yes stop_codon:yes gene_type:complete
MKNKIYLCSFASEDLDLSVNRFLSQAKSMNFYEEIKVFRPNDFSDELKIRLKQLFKNGGRNRYYGFDIWRPEIISRTLKDMPDGSILHYSDIGNHLNNSGVWRLEEYIKKTIENNMVVFDYSEPPKELLKKNYKYQKYYEYEFSKGDVFKYFSITEDSEIFKSYQIWGGTFFIKKSSFSNNFLQQWNSANENTHLFDDSISKFQNHKYFKGMRGCQSVFSIISKINKAYKFSASECEWAENNNGKVWDHIFNYPILAKRDKKFSIFKRFFNRQKKTLNRIKNKFF